MKLQGRTIGPQFHVAFGVAVLKKKKKSQQFFMLQFIFHCCCIRLQLEMGNVTNGINLSPDEDLERPLMAPSGRSAASRERLSGGSARLTLTGIWKDKGNNEIHFPDP